MKSATIAQLRDHLSAYLREIEKGERVLIRRRGQVVAELSPPRPGAFEQPSESALEDRLSELERQGFIRRGSGQLPSWCLAPIPGAGAPLLEALLEERESGR